MAANGTWNKSTGFAVCETHTAVAKINRNKRYRRRPIEAIMEGREGFTSQGKARGFIVGGIVLDLGGHLNLSPPHRLAPDFFCKYDVQICSF